MRRARAAFVATVVVALGILYGCYHCKSPDCSDLPPEPDPFETVTKLDAGLG